MTGDEVQYLQPDKLTTVDIGRKAWGLLSVAPEWTPPFFVVSGAAKPTPRALSAAAAQLHFDSSATVLVRSSSPAEGIDERGSLKTELCLVSDLATTLATLQTQDAQNPIHWIVQPFIVERAKGHLSNERRLCKDLRDWEVEFEPGRGQRHQNQRIAIRTWRDDRPVPHGPIDCAYRESVLGALEVVARWGYEQQIRLHFEWVWDGARVHVVQADECNPPQAGVQPKLLVHLPRGDIDVTQLEVFRSASATDFAKYRKLANVAIYAQIGYQPVPFYVLDDRTTLDELISTGKCSPALVRDLNRLTKRPLVIRTEGSGQMLPRSDELRSPEEAQNWLRDKTVRSVWTEAESREKICLIAHSFVPATASAWCLAHPDRRRVRIESLWGIPEGLYWYAHDVFDVDTGVAHIDVKATPPRKLPTRSRPRYKGVFIAPNDEGQWVLQHTATGPDWRPSIKETRWVSTIAWDSRRIAQIVGRSVIVMWLVDVPPEISSHAVMPWYHEPWDDINKPAGVAPRKKQPGASDFVIHTSRDWEKLKDSTARSEVIARVIVDPRDTSLIRNKAFAEALGKLAKEKSFIVELAGGILSHAYYTLARTGCAVECADLYATDEEQIEFNKLVRDGIPSTIEARGESAEVLTLRGDALIEALKRKIVEEAFEVADASSKTQITEELADLYEIVAALTNRLSIEAEDIESVRVKKRAKRGGFDDGSMLVRTRLEPSVGLSRNDTESEKIQPMPTSVSRIEELPEELHEINVDRRRDSSGAYEVQIAFTAPAYASGLIPGGKPNFILEAPNGTPHKMTLELIVERRGSEIRWIFHLRNAPDQLPLPLTD